MYLIHLEIFWIHLKVFWIYFDSLLLNTLEYNEYIKIHLISFAEPLQTKFQNPNCKL